MALAYRHGVYPREVGSGLVPPVRVDVSLPVVIGTAPIQTLGADEKKYINEPRLIFDFAEFVSQFGSPPEGAKAGDYTLYEFAQIYLARYGMTPFVAINVFDPAQHLDELSQPDVTQVTASDIIGGIDATTHERRGLELVEEIFPEFGLVPGQILAPKFSSDPSVALVIGAKAGSLNGHFRATGIVEIPASVTHFTEAPAWVKDNNLVDKYLMIFLGQPLFGDTPESASSHLAGIIAQRDSENSNIPYWSPSNKRMLANGLVHGDRELRLSTSEAAYLNGQGIVTGINWVGGLTVWGNRMAAYPGQTDPKDAFIPVRRMFNFVSNTLVLSAWQYLDAPLMRRRLVETVVDSVNVWINGLVAREFLLGGRVEFQWPDNPITDLMDGIGRFRVFLTPPSPARELEFILEYDPSYLANLFGSKE